MSRWGNFSFECDEVMDRVSDIWRQIFDLLAEDVIAKTLEEFYRRESNHHAFTLWKMCTIELSSDKIRRLGFLMASDPHLSKEFLGKIDPNALNKALFDWARSAKDKSVVAGVVSYFVRELGYEVPSKLREDTINEFKRQLLYCNNSGETRHLEIEILSLQSNQIDSPSQ